MNQKNETQANPGFDIFNMLVHQFIIPVNCI